MKFLCDRFISPLGLHTVGIVCGGSVCSPRVAGGRRILFTSVLVPRYSHLKRRLKRTPGTICFSTAVGLFALSSSLVWELRDQVCSSNLKGCWIKNIPFWLHLSSISLQSEVPCQNFPHRHCHRSRFLAKDSTYSWLLLSFTEGWEEHNDFHTEEVVR